MRFPFASAGLGVCIVLSTLSACSSDSDVRVTGATSEEAVETSSVPTSSATASSQVGATSLGESLIAEPFDERAVGTSTVGASTAALATADGAIDPVDPDMVAAGEAAEASLLEQAGVELEAQRAAVGGGTDDAVPVATSIEPQALMGRRAEGGLGFVGVGAALVTMSDAATGPPVSATTSASGPAGATATGSLELSVSVGRSDAGLNSASVQVTVEVEGTGGEKLTAKVSGRVEGRPCPDEAGLLEAKIEGESTLVAQAGTSAQVRSHFSGTARGIFDDNGEMSQMEFDLDVESTVTGPDGQGRYIEFTEGIRATGTFSGGGVRQEQTGFEVTRQSSKFDQSNPQHAEAALIARRLAIDFATGVLLARRERVQHDGCVVVDATAPGSVGAGQVVPFEVRTRHVVEGTALDKRVEATLSGEGSIDPQSLPATPDTITYTAGERPGDKGTITLVSRSRRGIGTTTLTIEVARSFKVDEQAGLLRLQGPVCSLEAPFTLSVLGDLPGTLTFTPNGSTGGSFSGSGTAGPGTIEWSGSYSVSGADTESPTIAMAESRTTLQPVGLEVPDFWSGGQTLTLVPDGAACPT